MEPSSSPSPKDLQRIYRSLQLIRRAEEEVARIYPSDKIKSPVHLSIGQESVAVGVCDVLKRSDAVSGTYRGHASYLAKGGPLSGMLAEMFGKATGAARGKGGSMHLVEPNVNVIGSSAVVGTTIPIAAGWALAQKLRKTGNVVAAFFGDGATEEGCFYETLNFASLHKLPILFVCENNGFAIYTGLAKRWASGKLCERVSTFDIPTFRIEDGDVFSIRNVTEWAVDYMRKGEGPVFMECLTYRWLEHVGPNEDFDFGHRGKHELAPWVENDQVKRVGEMLDAKTRARIDKSVEKEIADAVAFADKSPFPAPKALMEDIYAD